MIIKRDFWFLFFLIFIHSIYLTYQLKHKNIYLSDSKEYLFEADNIKTTGSFYCGDLNKPIKNELFTKRPPLYPLFLLIVKFLFKNNLAIIIIQTLLSIFNIYYIRHVIKQLGYNTKWDWLFMVILIFSPNQFFYANFIMSETILQTFIVFMFSHFAFFICNQKIKHIWYYSFFLIGALFTKPVFSLFIFPNVLMLGYLAFKYKRKVIFYISFIPIICFLMFSYNNYKKTSYFHFSSIGTINLFYYNTGLFLINQEGIDKASVYIDSVHNRSLNTTSLKEWSYCLDNASLHVIKEKWVSYSIFHIKGLAYFFLDPGRFDFYNFFNIPVSNNNGLLFYINNYGLIKGIISFFKNKSIILSIILFLLLLYNSIKTISIILFLHNYSKYFYTKAFLILVVIFLAVAAGPVGASRYSQPLNPLYFSIMLLYVSQISAKIKS
jgi:hypothetical protein